MANQAIKQWNQVDTTQSGDGLLLQRGLDYFYIDPIDLRLGLQLATLTISEAEIEALNTTPLTIVDAPGASSYIQPEAMTVLRLAGSAYATNQDVSIKFNGEAEADYFYEVAAILGTTAETMEQGIRNSSGVSLQANTALEVFVPAGDPSAAGTGSIVVYVWYRVLVTA